MEEAIFQIIRNKCHLSEASSIRLASRNITIHLFRFIDYLMEEGTSDFNMISDDEGGWMYEKDGGLYTLNEVYEYWRLNIFGTTND